MTQPQAQPFISQQSAPPARGRLAAFTLVVLALSCYLTVLPVFAPRLQQHFSITNRQLGTLLSCQVLGGLLGFALVLLLTARLGVRKATGLTALAGGVSFLVAGLARSLLEFQAGLLLVGMFAGAFFVSAMALLVELFPEWKRRMVAITLAASSAPAILFPPIAQWALSRLVDTGRVSVEMVVRGPMLGVGAVMMVGALLVWFSGWREEHSHPVPATRIRWRDMLNFRTLIVLLLAALHGGADIGMYSWMPRYMTRQFTVLPVAPGMVLAAYSVGYLVARLLQATLPEKRGQRAFLTLAGPIGGFTILAGIWHADALGLAVLYPLAGMIWGLEFPALIAEVETGGAAEFSGVVAGSQLASYLGAVGQLNLIGWLADRTDSFQIALTAPALALIAFGLIAAVSRLGKA
ncbi:MAG: MFS transporter [Armatimonadetes bacterium]|nr:MFS transporter [Armatimonadota bacterium]